MRIRTASIEELAPPQRALSARQLAAMQREDEIREALDSLTSDDQILAIELDPAEKVPTMRLAVKGAIARHRPGTSMAIRGRTIYISAGALPARGAPKAG